MLNALGKMLEVSIHALEPITLSVSVSVETRRSDDLYTGASPDGDGVEAERWPLLGGDGERKEMGRGRLEVLYIVHTHRHGLQACHTTSSDTRACRLAEGGTCTESERCKGYVRLSLRALRS